MISVLLFSRKPGKTSWAAVRGSEVVRARGLKEGDLLRVDFLGYPEEFFFRGISGRIEIPPGVTHVRVEHIKSTEKSRVCVDLE